MFVEIPHRRVFELVGYTDTRVRRYGIARIRQKLRGEIIAYGGEQYSSAHNAERRPDRGHGRCSLYHILQGIRRCKEGKRGKYRLQQPEYERNYHMLALFPGKFYKLQQIFEHSLILRPVLCAYMRLPQLVVERGRFEQLFVRAARLDFTTVDKEYFIRIDDGREPVRDDDERFTLHEF